MTRNADTITFAYKGHTFFALISRPDRDQPWKIDDILNAKQESIFQTPYVNPTQAINAITAFFTNNFMPI